MYTIFTVAGKEYKLRLRIMDIIQLEKKIGHNVMDMIMELQDGKLPLLSDMIAIIHAAMGQFNHGVRERDVYDIVEDYLAEGHNMFELLPVVIEILQNSGIVPKEEVQSEEE